MLCWESVNKLVLARCVSLFSCFVTSFDFVFIVGAFHTLSIEFSKSWVSVATVTWLFKNLLTFASLRFSMFSHTFYVFFLVSFIGKCSPIEKYHTEKVPFWKSGKYLICVSTTIQTAAPKRRHAHRYAHTDKCLHPHAPMRTHTYTHVCTYVRPCTRTHTECTAHRLLVVRARDVHKNVLKKNTSVAYIEHSQKVSAICLLRCLAIVEGVWSWMV